MEASRRRMLSMGALAVGGGVTGALLNSGRQDSGTLLYSGAQNRPVHPIRVSAGQLTTETVGRESAAGFLQQAEARDSNFAKMQALARRTLRERGYAEPLQVAKITAAGVPFGRQHREASILDRIVPTLHAEQYTDINVILTTYNDSGQTAVMNAYAWSSSVWAYSSCTSELDTVPFPDPQFYWESGEGAGVADGPQPGRRFLNVACGDPVGIAQKINRETIKRTMYALIGVGVSCVLTGPAWAGCVWAWGSGAYALAAASTLGDYIESCYL